MPAVLVAAVVTIAVNCVLLASTAFGANVAMVLAAFRLTLPATLLPLIVSFTVKDTAGETSDDGFIASLNVALMVLGVTTLPESMVLTATLVAPLVGFEESTVGPLVVPGAVEPVPAVPEPEVPVLVVSAEVVPGAVEPVPVVPELDVPVVVAPVEAEADPNGTVPGAMAPGAPAIGSGLMDAGAGPSLASPMSPPPPPLPHPVRIKATSKDISHAKKLDFRSK